MCVYTTRRGTLCAVLGQRGCPSTVKRFGLRFGFYLCGPCVLCVEYLKLLEAVLYNVRVLLAATAIAVILPSSAPVRAQSTPGWLEPYRGATAQLITESLSDSFAWRPL